MHPARILVVDDEPHVRETLARILQRLGRPVEVSTCDSAEAGLARLAREDFDVVVSDERMEGMRGTAMLALVREEHPAAVRILVTAHRERDIALAAVNDAHVHAYLEKPWVTADVIRCVNRLLDERDETLTRSRSLAVALAQATRGRTWRDAPPAP